MVRLSDKENENHVETQIPLSSYLREVNYSCASCGYPLNLSSGNRKASFLGSQCEKSIKSGIIRFFSIDDSRFRQVEMFQWTSLFSFRRSGGLRKRKSKLLCRRCGKRIGTVCSLPTPSKDEISCTQTYSIKLKSLLPSPYDEYDMSI